MHASPETAGAEAILSADRELDRRYCKESKLEIALWWVQATDKTYVTIEDYTGEHAEQPMLYRVEIPEGIKPKTVFDHPFIYLGEQAVQAAQQATEVAQDGRGQN